MDEDQKQRVRQNCPLNCMTWFTKAEKDEWDRMLEQYVEEKVGVVQ